MSASSPQRSTQSLEVELLTQLKMIVDVQISPNGRNILYLLSSINLEQDKDVTSLWSVCLDGGEPVSLIPDVQDIGFPRWSPDGHWIAFTQNQIEGTSKLFIMSVESRKPDVILAEPFKIGEPVWSPDGNYILFSATAIEDQDLVNGAAQLPQVIRQARYKADGIPEFLSTRIQLFHICFRDRNLVSLTCGEDNAYAGCWSPDGTKIVFCKQVKQGEEYDTSEIWVMDADGHNLSQLVQTVPHATVPCWSPDGQTIAFYGTDEQLLGEDEQFWRVWIISTKGGSPTCLTKNYDRSVIMPARSTNISRPLWSSDSRALIVRIADSGNIQLVRIQLDNQDIQVLTPGEHQVLSFSLAQSTDIIAFAISEPYNPIDIYVCNGNGSGLLRHTYINQLILESITLPIVEKRSFNSPHGEVIEGWLIRPTNRNKNLPLLLDIHGGPHGFIGNHFPISRFYRYVLATRGWAVLTLNPHGSGSYSQQFATSIHGRWGKYDFPEQMAAVDMLISEGLVDDQRLAVTGYSYGGYMTAWAISHTERFKVAVVGGAITNLESFYGTSDIGMWFLPWEMKGEVPGDSDLYTQLSPIKYVEHIRTPTLIMHGAADKRCPVSQSEELFVRLKALGQVPTEFVCYPESSHLFLSKGKPRYRMDYFNRLINWVDKINLN